MWMRSCGLSFTMFLKYIKDNANNGKKQQHQQQQPHEPKQQKQNNNLKRRKIITIHRNMNVCAANVCTLYKCWPVFCHTRHNCLWLNHSPNRIMSSAHTLNWHFFFQLLTGFSLLPISCVYVLFCGAHFLLETVFGMHKCNEIKSIKLYFSYR